MTFKQLTHDFPGGTSLRGYLPPMPYARLVAVFGTPTFFNGDKVQAEWVLQFADGTIATIYDYKDFPPVEAVTDWHVGGFHGDGGAALARVCEALGVSPAGR